MTLEAVNFDSGVVVATLTKIGFGLGHAVGSLAGVAVNAFFQAILASPYPTPEGVVPLVLEQSHMVAPHESWICHALTASRRFNHRLRNPRGRSLTRMRSPTDHKTKQANQRTKPRSHQSPSPIWM
jgi:hypothetical protein